MTPVNPKLAKFHQKTAKSESFNSVWTTVVAMIIAMIQAGGGASAIETEVAALVAGTGLPAYLQTLIIGMATGLINLLMGAGIPPAPVEAATGS